MPTFDQCSGDAGRPVSSPGLRSQWVIHADPRCVQPLPGIWASGGRRLLPNVGRWAVDFAREPPLATGILQSFVAGVKCTVALIPLLASRGRLPPPRWWRGVAWIAVVVLTGHGAVSSIVAWLVLGGVLRPEGGLTGNR